MRSSRKVALLGALAIVAGLLATPLTAQAQSAFSVRVGGFLGTREVPADGMRFYAPAMRVHAGDTITFKLRGFHTATLIPANSDVDSWARDNAGGIGKPFSLIAPDPDETSGDDPHTKFNNAAIFPSDQTCGAADNACSYDGTDTLNSGAFGTPSFTASIDASVGDVIWVVCLIHPEMRLRIEVVAGGDTTTTQEQIDAYKDNKIASDLDDAAALDHKLSARSTKHVSASGKVIHDAYAGFDGPGYALLANYPHKVVVRKGQKVRWHFSGLRYEDHSVTMPFKRGVAIARNGGGVPVCDPDGDAGPGPDNPPEVQGPPFCNDPSQLEFDISPAFGYPQGDGIHKRGDLDSSGVVGNVNAGKSPYTLKFTKTSSKDGFRYMCVIHRGGMDGFVRVKPR